MARPNHNPPNNDCPECNTPSKTYYIGSKRVTVAGQRVKRTRYQCEHKHEWVIHDPPVEVQPDS